MGGRPRFARVAFTEFARSKLESMSVPSRSKITSSTGTGFTVPNPNRPRLITLPVVDSAACPRSQLARLHSSPHSPRLLHRLLAWTLFLQLVIRDLPLQRVAVNPQQFAGLAPVALSALQRPRHQSPFENFDGLLHKEALFQQVIHKRLKCFLHCGCVQTESPCPLFFVASSQ